MKKTLILCLALAILCLTASALADEVILNAEIISSGAVVNSVTISGEAAKPTLSSAKFSFEKIVTRGRGENATTENVAQPVYSATWAADGSVTLVTDSFSPSSKFIITYAIPATADADAQVIGTWTEEGCQVKYAVVDDFILDGYTGTVKDADGNDLEVTIPYRLYVPENAENVPLVVTMHGSGESGTDGLVHMTANQLSTCWAEPDWQGKHPCIVLAPQWPSLEISNDLVLRDGYLAVYHDMIGEIIEKYSPTKTYLATLSMGSRLAYRYFTLYPEAYDAALMCCGTPQGTDLSALTDKPIWLVHAAADFVVASQNSVDAFNELISIGNPNIHLTLISDEGMNGVFSHAVWQYAFGDTPYMEWLFAQ